MAEYNLEIIDIERVYAATLYIAKSGEYLYALRIGLKREEFPPFKVIEQGQQYNIGDKIPYNSEMREVRAKMLGERIVYVTADKQGWPSQEDGTRGLQNF